MSYVLLIIFPLVLGASCFLIRKETQLVIGVSVAALIVQLALVLTVAVDQPVRLLGLTLNLDPLGRLFLAGFPAVTALMALANRRLPHGEHFVSIALIIIGVASAIVVLLQEPFVVALLLVSAGLLSVLAIVDLPTGAPTLVEPRVIASALKYLVLMAFAGALAYMGFVLITIYRPGISPDQTTPRLVLALIVVAFGIRIALVPFHSWLPDLVEDASPMVSALIIVVLNTTGLLFLISVFQFFPVLVADNERGLQLLTWAGALAALIGAFLALVQSCPRRTIGYLVVYNAGMILFGLATTTTMGLAGAVFEAFNQMLTVPLLMISLALLEQPDGRPSKAMRRDMLWRWPIAGSGLLGSGAALVGLPPWSGFASKMLLYEAAARDTMLLLLLIGATALALLAISRLARDWLIGAPDDQPAPETPLLLGTTELDLPPRRRLAPEPFIAALVVLTFLGGSLAIGLYPQPLLETIADVIRGLTFVRVEG
ncbi:proton-conducting transporter transmembrane domain-containing protein [Roseiflexus castenholzii]|jgi:formate hydrogenlyase subunit 3/multisubunit Na+/H+ antiporter MnhD subunit|uniref:NADH/Ubiquinone/plastoquinone (Complex I) n=1 Tax=Roseiflexus castenholzii (strain DSM 13941 / HLO8) TaxID=383372 RepID=A7NMN7_ROSCS|nr:proton-conducting transporter membrane subunit [Roseiflexus castenholzii]ABU58808.1 NADH/Ubiquinone/plastoquinone (complex I) [Roseiflexus castenholzii DSM 13941]